MGIKRISVTFQRFVMFMALAAAYALNVSADSWADYAPASLSDARISGSGTAGDPYIISDEKQMAYFGKVMGGNSQYWKLGAHINLSGHDWTFGSEFNPVIFSGHFDGGGFTIKGVNMVVPDDHCFSGFFCALSGSVENVELVSPALTLKRVNWAEGYGYRSSGALVGVVLSGGSVKKCKVTSPKITMTDTPTQYRQPFGLGGMIGSVRGSGSVTNCKVDGGSITDDASNLFLDQSSLYVGGLCGDIDAASSLSDCAVKDMTITLDQVVFYNGEPQVVFAVGGVVGNVMKPATNMPERILAWGCKINAPKAMVGPVAGVFRRSHETFDKNVITDDYSGEGDKSLSDASKTSTWMYNGYKLAVDEKSSIFKSFSKNYTASLTDGYLDVGNAVQTLPRQNRVNSSSRNSRTVLWYTSNNGSGTSDNNTQDIAPTFENWAWIPDGYKYFAQGYNVGSYVDGTQAKTFFNSVGNVETPCQLTLVDENVGVRGEVIHTLKLTVVDGAKTVNGTDDDKLTWTWAVDGVEKATGQTYTLDVTSSYTADITVLVTASDGTMVSYTIPRAFLRTQDGSDLKRGEQTNPYVIGNEKELRLWSELSRTMGKFDNYYENGVVKQDKVSDFNKAYFVLDMDIDMEVRPMAGVTDGYSGSTDARYKERHGFNHNDDFLPICGLTSEDIYDIAHTFRGTFDGQGHVIKNLHQIWRGGTLDFYYDEQATQSWGLFGVVSGGTIKNLIIDGAKLEHDVYNGSFFYEEAMRTQGEKDLAIGSNPRGTNCAVGVLAGMITAGTEIRDVDVKNSSIYASNVDLTAAQQDALQWKQICIQRGNYGWGLYVGGIVGRVQSSYDGAVLSDLGHNTKIHYVSSDVDIDIMPVRINMQENKNNTTAYVQRMHFNVGGIVGSMYSTGNYSTIPWPEHSFYTGLIRSMHGTASPSFGYVSYNTIAGENSYDDLHNHYRGYPGVITSSYYNNYYLRDCTSDENNNYNYKNWNAPTASSAMIPIPTSGLLYYSNASTGNYGPNKDNKEKCPVGQGDDNGGTRLNPPTMWFFGPVTDKNIATKPMFQTTDGVSTLREQKVTGSLITGRVIVSQYHGVNQGIYKDWNNSDNSGAVVTEYNERTDGTARNYIWGWDSDNGRPMLTSQSAEYLEVTGTDGVLTATLKGMKNTDGFYYTWYERCNENPVQAPKPADDVNHGNQYTIPDYETYKTHNRYFYAVATKTDAGKTYTYTSKLFTVKGTLGKVTATMTTDQTEATSSGDYTHETYLNVRISQEDYYKLSEEIREKTPATYYAKTNDGWNEYKKAVAAMVLYYDETNHKVDTVYDGFSANSVHCVIGGTYNSDTKEITPIYDEAKRSEFDKLSADDPALLKESATYYTFEEFRLADVRDGSYNSSSTPYSGYTYAFGGDPTSPKAGKSWPNRKTTLEDFNKLADTSMPKTVTTTMTVNIKPDDITTDSKYKVSYQWYQKNGTIISGATEKTYSVVKAADNNMGAYYCQVTVKDILYSCYQPVIFNDSLMYQWGEKYVFINPDATPYPIEGLMQDVPANYPLPNDLDRSKTGIGNDNNDGKTPFTPVRTWERAYALLDETASWDENIIVLIGKSSAQVTTSSPFGKGNTGSQSGTNTGPYSNWKSRGGIMFGRSATIQSKTAMVGDYQGEFEIGNCSVGSYQYGCFIWGDTRFRNMKFGVDQTSGYGIIFCQYNNLEMGDSLKFVDWPQANSSGTDVGPLPATVIPDLQIFGGINNDSRFVDMEGHINNYKEKLPHPEGFTITVKSGFYSNICASGRQTSGSNNWANGMAGCPDQPIKCNIVVDIDRSWNNNSENQGGMNATYDVGALMAGNHEGAQYGDMNIIVRSGIVGRITSGSLGNQRACNNYGLGGGYYAPFNRYGSANNVYFPSDTYFGRVNILIDPASSEQNSDTVINKRVVVSEIYGGALGRHMSGYRDVGVCRSMFYGTSNITINGGTFDLNTAEDGSSGDKGTYGLHGYNNGTTDNVTIDGKTYRYRRAQPGIYAGGAGGLSGIGVDSLHTNDMRLPYYSETVGTNYNKDRWGRVVLYDKYDVWKQNGGNSDNKVFVKCYDGLDEEGNKLYTYVDLTKTTSTITINGGNFFPSYDKTNDTGRIKNEKEQGCGIYGAGNGYVNYSLIAASGSNPPGRAPNPLAGSIFGTPGETTVQININGGTFNCDIFGGGKGNDAYYQMQTKGDWYTGWSAPYDAKAGDKDYLSYGVTRDNYGRNARIIGNVEMNINGGTFKHNIYGSGMGSKSCPYMAEIIGNTTINITSDSSLVKVYGNVFGGGNYAKTTLHTAVNIAKGTVYGDVFGGGNEATVGYVGSEPYYDASAYWSIGDNDEKLWGDVYLGTLTVKQYAEMTGIIRVAPTAEDGVDATYGERVIGELKPGNHTPAGYHLAGTGSTSVYTMTDSVTIYGNIFGGGNKADVYGNANVAMTAGAIAGNVFGGGNGYINESNANDTVPANIHGSTSVMLNGYTVLWNTKKSGSFNKDSGEPELIKWDGSKTGTNHAVFIGTRTEGTKGTKDYKEYITWNDTHNVYGGGKLLCRVDSVAQVTVTKGMTPLSLLKTDAWQQSYYDNNNPHFYVFGGGLGERTVAANTKVRVGMDTMFEEDNTAETTDVMAKGSHIFIDENGEEVTADAGDDSENINIYNNGYGLADYTVLGVLGGGFKGKIIYDTDVRVGGATFIHRVYGGGYGDPTREKADVPSDLGQVGRSARVLADGAYIYGDIFGGGARGDVVKSTYVELQRDVKVYGSVYGGGDVANVGSTKAEKVQKDTVSTTLISGGTVFHNVFGGGSKGLIQGSSFVNVVDTIYKNTKNIPYIYGDVYGGGEKHHIAGNANVLIEGGQMGGDIFGGGLGTVTSAGEAETSADVMKDTRVDINGGSMLWRKRCDDYSHGTVFTFENTASIPMSRFKTKQYIEADTTMIRVFYDYKNERFIRNHNVYGGGNLNSNIVGKAYVNVRHGLVTEGLQNYDENSVTPFAACWYDVIQKKAYPQFSVFGGGYGKHTTVHGTQVVMNVANDDDKNYAAYGEDSLTYLAQEMELLSRWDGLAVSTKESRYGGTNANAYRRYRSSRYAWSGGVHNHVMANIIGGSWAGKVEGDTKVIMDGTSGCRNVFGGGVGMATDSDKDLLGEVTGTSTVDVRNGIVSGDIYGGGAGIESKKDDDGVATTDYVNVARVRKGTKVSVDGTVTTTTYNSSEFKKDNTLVFGSVHGGGDVANVGNGETCAAGDTATVDGNPKFMTEVLVKGGILFSQVYGGGNGRPKSDCVDYTKLGAVYGNSKVTVTTPTSVETAPWLWNRVYAGGENGTVYGNSKLEINGGYLGYNVFGGGYGRVDTLASGSVSKTDAAITGNTYVSVNGGEWCVSQMWLDKDSLGNDLREWAPANIYGSYTYVPQYNPVSRTFIVNHNIYGGGNACSTIGGNTYVKMTKGLLQDKTILGEKTYKGTFFEQNEWREIYDKVGSAHFSVFGAGYGPGTKVTKDTYVDVSIGGDAVPSADFQSGNVPLYKRFKSYQSLLDIIGGGYSGEVAGNSNVHIGGNTFMRRAFAGGYFATVNSSKILVTSGDIDEVFGGGVIGDVLRNTQVTIGQHGDSTFVDTRYPMANGKLFINKNVYGANDVSGVIGTQNNEKDHIAGDGTHVLLRGGTIYGDVYGGGNGDYLYALGKNGETKVTPNENYESNGETYDLVYTVPMRPGMVSAGAASPAQTVVNISTFRPHAVESRVDMKGISSEKPLKVLGNVFGGGNSATIYGANHTPVVEVNVGDYVELGGLYLGSDGDALFMDSEQNPFLTDFQYINGINLSDTVVWDRDPANVSISTAYLPVEKEDRYKVYPHLIDLYFHPVEMSVQPKLTWNGSKDGKVTNTTIGIICCGGNRGNMNVYPIKSGVDEGKVVDVHFPKGLTVTGHIIGGCNNANYEFYNTYSGKITSHTGGYLLGERKGKNPMINLLVENQFKPSIKVVTTDGGAKHSEYSGGNVYGGCYFTGNIVGDVLVDLRSNMLEGLRSDYFLNAANSAEPACNVYGAGYGTNSYVYGDTYVLIGKGVQCETKSDTIYTDGSQSTGAKGMSSLSPDEDDRKFESYRKFKDIGTSANYIFGGGLQGNVVGNTNVRYYNGHTLHSVTGGSYAGYLWGSTQLLVGYPEYYVATKQKEYNVKRKDEDPGNLETMSQNINGDVDKAIKQKVMLMPGDIIAPTLYEGIVDADDNSKSDFTKMTTSPSDVELDWNNIAITIDEAIYGGGYSLASGSSVMANNTIVLKYDKQYNVDPEDCLISSEGYGGNTTMVVWDKVDKVGNYTKEPEDGDKNHISISEQDMEPIVLPEGTDMFGYYYKDAGGHYHYVFQENTYFAGKTQPKPAYYAGTYVSAYNFDAEGGMYGDGHLSFSEGFRTGELKGYGFGGGKTADGALLMNSFQRMDMLRLEDCNVIMLGARDYATNVTNTTPYSLSRIGELQMVSHINDTDSLREVVSRISNSTEGTKGARNFLGLSNHILYVGCIYTNTSFTDKFLSGGRRHLPNDTTYVQKKQDYVDKYYSQPAKITEGEFNKRNDATAKNMIGISSGYALKIQNVSSKLVESPIDDDGTDQRVAMKDSVFYGPIVGVAEVNLLSARIDEGGGYIYADNVHKRPANGDNSKDKEDFLMTTGNFVFPYDAITKRYILDDCYPDGYDAAMNAGKTPEKEDDIHYWYIEGYNYYYQLHITGWTSDSRINGLKFDTDNSDVLTIMQGAKKGQTPVLHSVQWRSNHPASFGSCDIDGAYSADSLTAYPTSMQERGLNELADATNKTRWQDKYYHLRVGVKDSTTLKYDGKGATGTIMRYTAKPVAALNNTILTDNPIITLQLEDKVDNTTSAYYKKHLSQSCQATIVLTVPALEDDGKTSKMQYLNVNQIFKDKKYDSMVGGAGASMAEGGNTIDMGGTYYYFSDATHQYEPLDMSKLYILAENSNEQYWKVNSLKWGGNDTGFIMTVGDDNREVSKSGVLFHTQQNYSYTLYLTIDYVQGPEVRGHIDIMNCALPGEMIKLVTDSVQIDVDESMPPIGYYWRIGQRKQNSDGTWSFCDETNWTPATATAAGAPKGYDSFKMTKSSERNGVFKGSVYNETENYLEVPAYYFMNGYGVQYGIEFNGMDGKIFPVDMVTADSLLVHNYHRMDPHSANKDLHLHLSEAVARAYGSEVYTKDKANWDKKKVTDGFAGMSAADQTAWLTANPEPKYVAPLSQPRIYIRDDQDMQMFYNFIDSVGRYDEGKFITKAQIGNAKIDVPTGGKYAQFYLQDNIVYTNTSAFYHTPEQDFEGDFDGMGHSIDMSDGTRLTNAPTLFKNVSGGVYNLGVIGRPIAQTVKVNDTVHVFNSFAYGMHDKQAVKVLADAATAENLGLDNCYDLTVAADEDFKYGKVAYNLNKYYLEERYRLAKGEGPNNDRIEQYYANGDYQYARRNDSRTGNTTGVVYLRSGNNDIPAYGKSDTRHLMGHYIDHARAEVTTLSEAEANTLNERYNREYEFEINSATTGSKRKLTKNPYNTSTIKSVVYKPLFDEAYAEEATGKMDVDTLRNDYLLFGQRLDVETDPLPKTISSSMNMEAYNRVWRASGFYGTKLDEGFYYNALDNVATMVHDPRLTAVDFSCYRDGDITEDSYYKGMSSVNGEPTELQSVYYAPAKDTPTDAMTDKTYWGFGIGNENVTKNLLVYTKASTNIGTIVNTADEHYVAATPEEDIKFHQVIVSADRQGRQASLLHLVDKEDFNAPIEFTADTAWYVRNPEIETGYVEKAGEGWESITLPYTVRYTTLSSHTDGLESGINQYYDYKDTPANERNTLKERLTNLSFFYGAQGNEKSEENPGIIGQHYWLRGIDVMNRDGAKVMANFVRPLYSIRDMEPEHEAFKAYTPFVVSFPGSRFYEFDMTGQSLVFGASATSVAVTDDAVLANAKTVTLDSVANYTYKGAFANDKSSSKYAIALKSDAADDDEAAATLGDRFTANAPIYPFRAYMTSAAASAPAKAGYQNFQENNEAEVIYISALGISLEDKGIEEPETEDVIESDGLRIYPSGKRIVVESTYDTTLNVYSAGGQLVRVLDVRRGTSIYSGFASGIYLIDSKKLMLK